MAAQERGAHEEADPKGEEAEEGGSQKQVPLILAVGIELEWEPHVGHQIGLELRV